MGFWWWNSTGENAESTEILEISREEKETKGGGEKEKEKEEEEKVTKHE